MAKLAQASLEHVQGRRLPLSCPTSLSDQAHGPEETIPTGCGRASQAWPAVLGRGGPRSVAARTRRQASRLRALGCWGALGRQGLHGFGQGTRCLPRGAARAQRQSAVRHGCPQCPGKLALHQGTCCRRTHPVEQGRQQRGIREARRSLRALRKAQQQQGRGAGDLQVLGPQQFDEGLKSSPAAQARHSYPFLGEARQSHGSLCLQEWPLCEAGHVEKGIDRLADAAGVPDLADAVRDVLLRPRGFAGDPLVTHGEGPLEVPPGALVRNAEGQTIASAPLELDSVVPRLALLVDAHLQGAQGSVNEELCRDGELAAVGP
mmetsp:Transcript_65156/g.210075  ORF Transcript_65156/g.210075 Transcript_65156/m.210075 type:complete len:319 (-) Transcript_65156:250-1206(-)